MEPDANSATEAAHRDRWDELPDLLVAFENVALCLAVTDSVMLREPSPLAAEPKEAALPCFGDIRRDTENGHESVSHRDASSAG
jgi:hypothetical protein